MDWVSPQMESPRNGQEVVCIMENGDKAIACYQPRYGAPWVIQLINAHDGCIYAFYMQLENVKYWSQLPEYKEDLE